MKTKMPNPENSYNRRNVPIWALPSLDLIQNINPDLVITDTNTIGQGTLWSRMKITVFIPEEGYYEGYLSKAYINELKGAVCMPPLYQL